MNVDFNNVRRQAMIQFEELTKRLNAAIIKDEQAHADTKDNSFIRIDGYVLIDADEIQKQMDDLRMLIGIIAGTSDKDNPYFIDIYKEQHPNDRMVRFNDQE